MLACVRRAKSLVIGAHWSQNFISATVTSARRRFDMAGGLTLREGYETETSLALWSSELEDIPSDYENLGYTVMSNFDHEIDEKVAEKLTQGKHFADYPGWEFHATVWYDAEKCVFKAKVMRYCAHVGTAISTNLAGIMMLVSDRYGWE